MLKILGDECRKYRKEVGLSVKIISEVSGYSVNNIYKFEEGRISNVIILLYYINFGFELDDEILCKIFNKY